MITTLFIPESAVDHCLQRKPAVHAFQHLILHATSMLQSVFEACRASFLFALTPTAESGVIKKVLSMVCLLFFATQVVCYGQPSNKKIRNIPQVDAAVEKFMADYQVSGVSVAISKGEKLVYVKSYGLADTANRLPVTSESLFRIASISKPITAVTILKLVEEGKLTLDQKVFGEGGLLGTTYGSKPYDQRILALTVRHLLDHSVGGWGNTGGKDPMFLDASWSQDSVINYTLDNTPLLHDPGQQYAYSNFGYCLLGRIIEVLTGQNYEQYVKTAILVPMGITDMHIGGNTLAQRSPNEVIYYGTENGGLYPYIYNITRMDAHGGWLASATDLIRFMTRVDGFSVEKDLLSAATVSQMTTLSTAGENETYALGWRVDGKGNWWHSGSLPGTGTHLTRMGNGFNWTVLTNARVSGREFFPELMVLLNDVTDDPTIRWTEID